MTSVWALAAFWLGLALVASLLSIWFRVSTALSEIIVGTIAQLIIGAIIGQAVLGTDESWVKFLSGIWERWRTGPTVKQYFQPISSAWCLRERLERIMRSFDGCALGGSDF